MTDAALIERARDGDADARAALAEEFAPKITRYLTAMLGEPAEDLAQQAFAAAFDRLGDLRDAEKFGSWLYSIAINQARSELKRRAAEPTRESEPDAIAGRTSVLSSIVRRESAEALALAIERLPIALREAFVLRVLEELPYATIVDATETPERTLHVRVHRAKALLRSQLGKVVDTYWSG